MALKAEIKERESELEDLGCWRSILLRRRRPTKKLTQVNDEDNGGCYELEMREKNERLDFLAMKALKNNGDWEISSF